MVGKTMGIAQNLYSDRSLYALGVVADVDVTYEVGERLSGSIKQDDTREQSG
jgi:hypothetical protein